MNYPKNVWWDNSRNGRPVRYTRNRPGPSPGRLSFDIARYGWDIHIATWQLPRSVGGYRMQSISRSWQPLLLGALMLLPGAAVVAGEDNAAQEEKIVSPDSIDGVTNVDAEGLIGMVMQLSDLVLIDSRIISDRNEGYIEGSVSLPDIDTNCDALGKVANTPLTPMLFYCNGVRCGRSANAAEIALSCGYSDIYWFRNGIEEWQEKEYPLVQ